MKNIGKIIFAILLLASFSLTSCKKEKEGTVKIVFNYVWGSSEGPFALGTQLVHPRTQDSLTFNLFKFYVSNIKLKKEDGTYYEVSESYYLMDASSVEKSTITLTNVPSGKYVGIEYVMGVDSTRNVSGAQTGALSTSEGMFWSWNSGYIMLKAEGNSPQSTTGAFSFHLGGFSGANNIVTARQNLFNAEVMDVHGHTNVINMKVNPARLWHTADGVATTNTLHMPGATAKTMATDFYAVVNFNNLEEEH